MKAKNLFIARKVSSDGESLYIVPVTVPGVDPSPFDDRAKALNFSEEESDPNDYVGTFWVEETMALSDQKTYSKASPLDAYDALEEYEKEAASYLSGLKEEAANQARNRVNEIESP